ncbi:MAG: deoxyribose-phosphate aldolase [Planctomycetota bacterium]
MPQTWTNDQLAQTFDAAVLAPALSPNQADEAIRACVAMNCKTACVRPVDVQRAKAICVGSGTGVCVVVGFPHGTNLPASKADEARRLVEFGADEVDVVVHYGAALGGDFAYVRDEVAAVVDACGEVPMKTIFETSQLDDARIAPLVEAAIAGGAAFVKTSTGFTGEGANERAVQLMLDAAAGRCQVKPSGGIRDRATAERYLAMGATRLGVGWTSARAILQGDASDAAY